MKVKRVGQYYLHQTLGEGQAGKVKVRMIVYCAELK
jgi:hypothetical protein